MGAFGCYGVVLVLGWWSSGLKLPPGQTWLVVPGFLVAARPMAARLTKSTATPAPIPINLRIASRLPIMWEPPFQQQSYDE